MQSALRQAPAGAGAAASCSSTRRSLRASAASTSLTSPTVKQPRDRRGSSSGGDADRRSAAAAAASGTVGTQLLPWFNRPDAKPTAPVALDKPGLTKQPILSFAGGGIFFWWELGVLKYLHRHFDLTGVQLVGASAGGLVATLAACGVSEDRAVRMAHRLAEEQGVFSRPSGLAGVWGTLVRAWLEELLPQDAAERCSGRVRLVVTEVPSLRLRYLDQFSTRQDLIDANMASVHIPFFLDGAPSATYAGAQYIDGSLWDFIMSSNSQLIQCGGEACVVDYFNDDQLQWSRLDFLKLCDLEQVQAFVQSGYAYAERTDAAGNCFEATLGGVRKGAVRRALELPVWGLRSALGSVG